MKASPIPAALWFLASSLSAAELTGENLRAACASPAGSKGDLACNAFVAGFAAGVVAQRLLEIQGYAICVPPGAGVVSSRQAIQTYLEAHPDLRDVNAAALAADALFKAFPCPR